MDSFLSQAPASPDPLESPSHSPTHSGPSSPVVVPSRPIFSPSSPSSPIMGHSPVLEWSSAIMGPSRAVVRPESPVIVLDATQPLTERNDAVNENSNDSNATVRSEPRVGSPLDNFSGDSNTTQPYNIESNFSEDSSTIPDPVFALEDPPDSTSRHTRPAPEGADEPPAKMRKISKSDDEQDGETCPICLDSWGNSGDHRLVALKCGHLFGAKCVERWLRAQVQKDRSCPTCKSKATARDLRFIYARKLVAADTSEITTLQKQNENLQAEKSRVELELQKTKIAHRACLQQLDSMRSMLARQSQPERQKKTWRFALEKNLEISKDGGCRVCCYNCRTYELYVSQKSTNNLFPGYGVRKVSCVDYKLNQFIHLHTKPLRDLKYSQPKDLFISVSLDKTFRIVERGQSIMNVETTEPLWSCTWDYVRPEEFYIGGFRGIVYQYDIRNTSSYLHRLVTPLEDKSQIISLSSTEHGLITCSINSSWLWTPGQGEWISKTFPVDGPFLPMSYDHETNRAVLTCRPKSGERSKLVVCKLNGTIEGDTSCVVENSFSSSNTASFITRPTWVKASGATWVAGYSESESSINLYGLEGVRSLRYALASTDAALDLVSIQLNSDTILAALSETRLRMYKAVST